MNVNKYFINNYVWFFLLWCLGSNPKPYIYYASSLPTKLNLLGQLCMALQTLNKFVLFKPFHSQEERTW